MMSSNKWFLNTGLTVVTLVDDESLNTGSTVVTIVVDEFQYVVSQHWFDCSDLSG